MFDSILKTLVALLDFWGAGTCSLEAASGLRPYLIFMMGMHEIRTLLAAARFVAKALPQTPIVISGGGVGRGSWLLEQAVTLLLLLHDRPALSAEERKSEARIIRRLCVDEGIPRSYTMLDEEARHTRENWELSVPIFKALRLPEQAVIVVVQSPLNRARALATGKQVLRDNGFGGVRIETLDFPRPNLLDLCERERTVEMFRMFGAPGGPTSELVTCESFQADACETMPPDLKARARQAERDFHALLEMSPGYAEHFRGALKSMDPAVRIGAATA